jgi:16S rRNA (guanine(966)-N(2))-methyltransferase RsmD
MRIIGGTFRARKLKSFQTAGIRPTADRIREAIFNILPHRLDSFSVLDLFAGTGAFGLEALSRGAQFCTFVDKNRAAISIVSANLSAINCQERARLLRQDALLAIPMLESHQASFDLIFLDPPYDSDLNQRAIQQLGSSSILTTEGIVIVEKYHKSPDISSQHLEPYDERKYGETTILFWRKKRVTTPQDSHNERVEV